MTIKLIITIVLLIFIVGALIFLRIRSKKK